MADNGHLSLVFPGQGSQSVGMLKALAADFPMVTQTFQEASQVLGFDLWQLAQEGPAAVLDQTQNTQPAMLAADVAVWRVWKENAGPAPVAMAGHSLGEYAALVCAGSLEFADALRLVAERGRLMQEAVPEGSGGMAAVLGLDDATVQALCTQAAGAEVVEAVNFNAPGQVVAAGNAGAVDRLIALARAAGAKRAIRLSVSVPAHCSLMKSAAQRLALRLAATAVKAPAIPVIHNVSVAGSDSPDGIRELLARQLYSPVRWVQTVREMVGRGVHTSVELGPGKVLSGLIRRVDRSIDAMSVQDGDSLRSALGAVKNAGK